MAPSGMFCVSCKLFIKPCCALHAKHPKLCCLHQLSAAGLEDLCLQEVDAVFPNKKIVNKMNEMMDPPFVSQVHAAGWPHVPTVIIHMLGIGRF